MVSVSLLWFTCAGKFRCLAELADVASAPPPLVPSGGVDNLTGRGSRSRSGSSEVIDGLVTAVGGFTA